ncbi:endonuclease/exonuclease/phosphatase family protein [Actinomadura chibensis]|uniref:Endonuclease/exonuclease/phosphatase n=1 Tax=Actinomadura chibensis TaxID=392828 RepID=A0A5D0NYA2_9ACTN|nr:endonuclease/exonuclease/phosphatase family protein [Actinomadura chibensis]TYB49129.1 endonuclease/exonuclease/phosphatase [Actinomadura chibensis]
MRVRVLTFNTLFRGRARTRIGALAEIVERADYDVVCLQEVISPLVLARLRGGTPSYPHRARGHAFPLVRGGLVTLSRRPITRSHFLTYTSVLPARPEWLLRKGALFTRVRLPDGYLTVVNTHLSANLDVDWSPSNAYAKVEESELRELASAINRIPRAEPLVVVGDFNVPRESPFLRAFTDATGLANALAGDAEPTFRPEIAEFEPIDQILVRPGIEATARLVFKDDVPLPGGGAVQLSDHFGIDATLTVGAA